MSHRKGTSRCVMWDVFLRRKKIDTVFQTASGPDEVKRSLVNHDGYDGDIKVRCRRKSRR